MYLLQPAALFKSQLISLQCFVQAFLCVNLMNKPIQLKYTAVYVYIQARPHLRCHYKSASSQPTTTETPLLDSRNSK